MNKDSPNILLVNPWIHDFAAFDFWAKPMGLLILASILIKHDVNVCYADCLDRFHPMSCGKQKKDGRGPYRKTPIPRPAGIEDVKRTYCRYGIDPDWLKQDLKSIPKPDLILVTSAMTYQYPGVFETIKILKDTLTAPVVLGGIYATLCRDHALKYSGADLVVSGPGEPVIMDVVKKYTGWNVKLKFDPYDINSFPYPAFNLQRKTPYAVIMTSRGCPYSCKYCASKILSPKIMKKTPEKVAGEIVFWNKSFNITEIAFYDDALLTGQNNHGYRLLQAILQTNVKVNFHTPNALHANLIDSSIAELMYKCGFKTVRIGLETADFKNRLDNKLDRESFLGAVKSLREAGFGYDKAGAYILYGLPNQDIKSVKEAIGLAREAGITPVLAYYTPIPGTPLWKEAVASSRYDLESDPVFTNNAIFPCSTKLFAWEYKAFI